jgi:DNA adenine methylase
VEIINDINVYLVALFRVVKHHLDEFAQYLRWLLVARDEFERFKKENPETLTDIQRAVRFDFVLKNSFSGRVEKPSFSISAYRVSAFNLLRVEEEKQLLKYL